MIRKWDSATTLRFVEEYAKRTCLWDVNNSNYKCRAARDAAVDEIVRTMNAVADLQLLPVDVKSKIRIIRNTYINEVKKMRTKRSTAGEYKGEEYVCHIPWFETADRFLRKVVRKKKFPDNLVSLDEDNYSEGNCSIGVTFVDNFRTLHSPSSSAYPQDDPLALVGRIKQEAPDSADDQSRACDDAATDLFSADESPPPSPTATSSAVVLSSDFGPTCQNRENGELTHATATSAAVPLSTCPTNVPTTLREPLSATGAHSDASAIRSSHRRTLLLSQVHDDSADDDEFAIFATNVAAQLRKLPLVSALRAEAKIHRILMDYRIEHVVRHACARSHIAGSRTRQRRTRCQYRHHHHHHHYYHPRRRPNSSYDRCTATAAAVQPP